MGVPAHDERDFLFAKKYDIKIVQVLKKSDLNNTKTFDPLFGKNGTQVKKIVFASIQAHTKGWRHIKHQNK